MRHQGVPTLTFIEEIDNTNDEYVRKLTKQKYEFGFTTDIHTEIVERGPNEDVIWPISDKKGEPEWMLEFRLKAYRH